MKLINILFGALFLFTSVVHGKDTIRITNGEWPPYLSKKLPHYGFASHLITEAFATVNVEVEYGFFPWKRAFRNAQEGTDRKSALSFKIGTISLAENE